MKPLYMICQFNKVSSKYTGILVNTPGVSVNTPGILVDTPGSVILAYFITTSSSFLEFGCAIHTIPKRTSNVLILSKLPVKVNHSLPTYLPTYFSTYQPPYLPTFFYLSTFLPTSLSSYLSYPAVGLPYLMIGGLSNLMVEGPAGRQTAPGSAIIGNSFIFNMAAN